MSAQLVFDLTAPPALGRSDFFVSTANELAVRQISDPSLWPEGKLLLVGPRGAGKTHLAQIWAEDHSATIVQASATEMPPEGPVAVEDVDRIAGDLAAETALFHLHNRLRAARQALLMTGTGEARDWAFALPDLASRVTAAAVARLSPPDDELLAALLVKLFADRQIAVAPPLIRYLAERIERSFAGAHDAVAALDAAALSRGRPVTRALAADVLDFDAEAGE